MGRMVEKALAERGIPCAGWSEDIASFDPAVARESVCIDFTTPDAFRTNYPILAARFKAVVVGTTGWYDSKEEVFACFRKAGTPLIWASNFSVGVTVLSAAVELVSKLLARAGGYAPYIVEKHHCHKLDAPSGTALALFNAVREVRPSAEANCGRSGQGKRTKDEVGIHAIRMGNIVGVHEVMIGTQNERITLKHEAFSRGVFAEGSLKAAAFLIGKASGLYNMKDLLSE